MSTGIAINVPKHRQLTIVTATEIENAGYTLNHHPGKPRGYAPCEVLRSRASLTVALTTGSAAGITGLRRSVYPHRFAC